ncbi:CcdB family protein [Methylovulum miyakonense]|uniref:CcdB family protein n=1 Tax=Methylovulum miyakonense TaxID=645578 RepID=UPI0003619900|nr:CcdB family protein [Methylovulum miyakonense]
MPQFDLHENRNPKTKGLVPYLLDVQSDLLGDLASTVVIPLCPAGIPTRGMTRLTPCLEIDGESYLLLTPQLAGIPRKELGKAIGNLGSYRDEIVGAVDFLLVGF